MKNIMNIIRAKKNILEMIFYFIFLLISVGYFFSNLYSFSDFPKQDELLQLKTAFGVGKYFTAELYTKWLWFLHFLSPNFESLVKLNFIAVPLLLFISFFLFHKSRGISFEANLIFTSILMFHNIHYLVERKLLFFISSLMLLSMYFSSMFKSIRKRNLFLVFCAGVLFFGRVEFLGIALLLLGVTFYKELSKKLLIVCIILLLNVMIIFISLSNIHFIEVLKTSFSGQLDMSFMALDSHNYLLEVLKNLDILILHFFSSLAAMFGRIVIIIFNPVYINQWIVTVLTILLSYILLIKRITDFSLSRNVLLWKETLRSQYLFFYVPILIVLASIRFNSSYYPLFIVFALSFLAHLLNFKLRLKKLKFFIILILPLCFLVYPRIQTNELNETLFIYPVKSKMMIKRLIHRLKDYPFHKPRVDILAVEDIGAYLNRNDLFFSQYFINLNFSQTSAKKFKLSIHNSTRNDRYDAIILDKNTYEMIPNIESELLDRLNRDYSKEDFGDDFYLFKIKKD